MPTMPKVPTRSRSAAPAAAVPFLPAARSRTRRDDPHRPACGRDAAPSRGRSSAPLDLAPPRPLGARALWAGVCCRETIRTALHRRKLSWTKAKKRLGRADPERRQAFVEQLQGVLAGAQRDQHLVVFLDEAHIRPDCDLGSGWATRGERFWVASRSPRLSARVTFY